VGEERGGRRVRNGRHAGPEEPAHGGVDIAVVEERRQQLVHRVPKLPLVRRRARRWSDPWLKLLLHQLDQPALVGVEPE
jgi:hypothetical protein